MSYTSWKKRLKVGARIHVTNVRRPWRTRHMLVTSASKRMFTAADIDATVGEVVKHWNFELPPAAFTRVADEDSVELLAREDGPRWGVDSNQQLEDIQAGEPYMVVKILS